MVVRDGRRKVGRLDRQRRARFQRQRRVQPGLPGVRIVTGARQRFAKRHDFGFWRIAKTRIRAALPGDGKGCASGGVRQSDRDGQALAVNFTFTVKLVLMPFA